MDSLLGTLAAHRDNFMARKVYLACREEGTAGIVRNRQFDFFGNMPVFTLVELAADFCTRRALLAGDRKVGPRRLR